MIVGARDPNTGILMEGMDPNDPTGQDEGGSDTPIIRRPITPPVVEEEDKDVPPNVIGGGVPLGIITVTFTHKY